MLPTPTTQHLDAAEARQSRTRPSNVREFFERAVDDVPDASFMICGDQTWSYAEFDASCNRVSHGLLAAGVAPTARLAYQLPNGLALLRLELAAQKIGAVTVPLIPGSTASETEYVLTHSGPTHIVTDATNEAAVRKAVKSAATQGVHVEILVVPERRGSLGALESDVEIRPPEPPHREPCMSIRYTSGSTGRPKGVVQPAAGFATAGHAIADRLGLSSDDAVFCAMPLFHTAATHMMFAPAVAARCRFVLVPRFSRATFWDEVRGTGGTVALLMPTQLSILMTAPPADDDADNPMRIMFSHVRSEDFCRRFGVDVCTTWAMTETSGMGTLQAPESGDHRPKVIGKPMPDDAEIRIVGPDGNPVGVGELGELCFRHPDVMLEYHRDPANTGSTLRDGWVHSGDLCSMDADGNAFFHGRLKNVIKRGGENVAGEEVEFTIMAHPAVEECLVTGVEDEIYTEEVCAVVVTRDAQRLTEAEIVDWCAQRLSSWKVPRYVHLRGEALPKLANGKTNRGAVTGDVAAFCGGRLWDRQGGA
ncbi:class I adenylate-forming enzyme family protein [Pseudonocardia acidicola]|uniref:ATP-dependent acyl-CoA ligase n=1 Tax=Pseudonocardia acidicola TaxID=2724939 RepID=A0ABX1S510_9PSEU|nr:AMP-binding protein [Pseudonocardia acidicola]NMH96635.1 ATP-dependent acyl-CoA ligase [Pseudonocardia acidicola]